MSEHLLIYDDACPICRSVVRKIRRLDHRQQVRPVPIVEAVRLSLKALPPLRALRLPGRLPGVEHLAHKTYHLMARNRAKISALLGLDNSKS